MPTVDRFERTARRLRRRLRTFPILEPIANRAGMWLWRRHLDRLARESGLTLPQEVDLDPRLVRRRLPPGKRGRHGTEVEMDSRWDRQVVPLRIDGAPSPDNEGPVVIAYDRKGRICLMSGEQELRRAGDAGRTVPARVALRHGRWARLALRVMAYARQRGGSAYQPYLHPDLATVASDQGHERFELLLAALPVRSGALLDLGANAGYFSHRFEAAGFDCIAVERSEKEAYFLTSLRDALDRRFEVFKGSLTDFPLRRRLDVVLALNIFHHFLKTEASFDDLRSFLQRLETRHMLFESHLPGDPQMASAAHDFEPEDFARFIAGTAGLDRVQRLGAAADSRPLFLLSAAGMEASTGART